MGRLVAKRFDLLITTAGQRESREWTLDQLEQFNGIHVTSDREDLLYHRGTQRIVYNGDELVPEDYESKLLMTGLNVGPNQRAKTFIYKGGNGVLRVEFTDNNHPNTVFVPYRVSIYAEYEVPETVPAQ